MANVLVVGAGISGCTVAYTLAECGVKVSLLEKSGEIGGKVRKYGCKAVEKCQNCGVCLTVGLWDKVEGHDNIEIIKEQGGQGDRCFVDAVVISTGFENQVIPTGFSSHLHISGTVGIITGTQLEELMLGRTATGLFEGSDILERVPNSIAFIQCVGSRDLNEGGLYCSRVCCSYSTRAAKVIRRYYPECEIVFFYMELQSVEAGNYFAGLRELGMEFIKCRPLKISGGAPASNGDSGSSVVIEYDDPTSGITSREFDLVVLSDGIHAGVDNGRLAEVCRLCQDRDGFLNAVGTDSGIYVTGCARAPMKIDEAYADALAVAGAILASPLVSPSEQESEVKKP